jgi:hypothetical protein
MGWHEPAEYEITSQCRENKHSKSEKHNGECTTAGRPEVANRSTEKREWMLLASWLMWAIAEAME